MLPKMAKKGPKLAPNSQHGPPWAPEGPKVGPKAQKLAKIGYQRGSKVDPGGPKKAKWIPRWPPKGSREEEQEAEKEGGRGGVGRRSAEVRGRARRSKEEERGGGRRSRRKRRPHLRAGFSVARPPCLPLCGLNTAGELAKLGLAVSGRGPGGAARWLI